MATKKSKKTANKTKKKTTNRKNVSAEKITKEKKGKSKSNKNESKFKKFISMFVEEKNSKEQEKDYFTSTEVIIITAIAIIFGCILGSIITSKTSLKGGSKELEEFTVAYNNVVNNYYKKVNKEKLIGAAIDGMLNYLGDPHTVYMSKEETETFNQSVEGKYKGIGATVTEEDGKTIVVGIFKNSPAEKAGLQEGDVIISVNGKSTEGKKVDEVIKMIKSKDTAKITIKRKEEELKFKIKLDYVDLPSVSGQVIEKQDKKIGLLSISTFAKNTASQLTNELSELEKSHIDGLIIDVRSNTGGYLDQANKIISQFMNNKHVIYQIEANNKKTKYYSSGTQNKAYKIAVLVNGGSASASEILAAAFKESLGSEIIGTKTYGKGTVQVEYKLASGASMKYTIENWLTPKGNYINEKGITPTIEVELSDEYYNNPTIDNDNQLQKALETLTK